jgi:Phytanoyl-CoA dioxygenase (PhyH)
MSRTETTTVVEEALEGLKTKGYAKLERVYDSDELERALELIEKWHDRSTGAVTTDKPPMAEDTPMVWNLQAKDPFFVDMLFRAENLHRVLTKALNDPWYRPIPQDEPNYTLRNFVARSSDRVRLPMHIDSFIPYRGPYIISMTCSIALDDSSLENGCTMVVPGSHQSGEWADQKAFDDAIPMEAKAGDIVMWDSRTWHGAHENTSGRTRWVMNVTFTPWWVKPSYDIPRGMPQEIYETLTPSQKVVMGFCSIPYRDETVGIDHRRGYDALQEKVADYWA